MQERSSPIPMVSRKLGGDEPLPYKVELFRQPVIFYLKVGIIWYAGGKYR